MYPMLAIHVLQRVIPTPVDPIFDLATDLGQADDILSHPSKLHLYHQSRWGKIRMNAGKRLRATLRDPLRRVRPWTIFSKKNSKILKSGNMIGWHLKPRSSCSSTTQDIMIDTFKFTSKSKIWNNFCVGYSIRKLSAHLSPDLYSRRAKGQVWGILLTVINDQFWPSTPAQTGTTKWNKC